MDQVPAGGGRVRQATVARCAPSPLQRPACPFALARLCSAPSSEVPLLKLNPFLFVPLPVSPGPYERNEISKDGFKLILKKTSEKVVKSYQREGLPPPANSDVAENQRKKIERLVEEYIKFTKDGAV